MGLKQFQVGSNANETISLSLSSTSASDIGVQSFDMAGDVAGFGEAGPAANDAATASNGVVGGVGAVTIVGKDGLDTLVDVAAEASASTVASAINANREGTGVEADARTQLELSNLSNAGALSFKLNGNVISANPSSPTDMASIAQAVNDRSGETGVAAEVSKDGNLILTDESGENINFEDFEDSTGAGSIVATGVNYDGTVGNTPITLTAGGTDSTTAAGTIRLSSINAFSITAADLTVGSNVVPNVSELDTVGNIDIQTQSGSQNALAVIDGAIAKIDAQRADLGAIQNRFSHTISNLANISENVSASRSRIQDTDFATETAEMTKNQILQQAGTSILSQANQIPQAALSLLGG